jgi:acetyl-CoA carboxylase carboxyl transferase subunit beta
MSWLTNIPPKIRALVNRPEVPDHLWKQCPGCEQMIFHRELDAGLQVCQHCGHHMRISALRRIEIMMDDGSWNLIDLPETVTDPLKFRDRKRYSDRIKDSRGSTGETDAILVAEGEIGGIKSVVAAFNFEFMGGSMGIAVGDGILTAARRAVEISAPLIVIPSSGGARMQEGILSLMQMPRTTIAIQEVREAGLPYIVILADPTTGGVSASFAMLGDITIAEPGAVIGFAGARVIEETIHEKLPEGFQRAEYLLEHGMIDMVVHRHEIRDTLVRVLGLVVNRRLEAVSSASESEPHAESEAEAHEPDSDAEELADEPKASSSAAE